MPLTRRASLGLLALGFGGPLIAPAFAAEAVGKVTRVQGPASRISEGQRSDLALADPIHLLDTIDTAAGSKLELTFDDGTLLTMGERTHLTIDAFVYAGAGRQNLMGLSVVGPFRYVSGKLTKAPAFQASVTTPVATIGIRGTDFWGGPIAGAFGVVLFDGTISVTNPAGQAILTAPGTGVDLDAANLAPGPVTNWAQPKIDQAVATIAF